MQPLTIGWVIGSAALREEIQSAMSDLPVRVVLEQEQIRDWVEFLQKLERLQPDVLLVSLDQLADPLDDVVRQLKSATCSPMVILVHTSADPANLLKAIRAGADEYLFPPLQADLRRALERMATERAKVRAGTLRRGKVFGFLSAKGGCGATTLACHVAVALHQQTQLQVLLGDFDFEAGIVGLLMKSQSRYTVLDAVSNIQRLDLSFWKALVTNGYAGVEVITAPGGSPVPGHLNVEDLRYILPFVRSNYDWTVIDLGRSLSPLALAVLPEVDETFLVTTPEIPALHQAKQIAQSLPRAGYGRQQLHVILNRTPKRADISAEELERMLGAPIYALLPSDYPALYEAYAEGSLVPANSNLGRHFSRLAAKMAGVETKDKRRFRIF